MVISVCSRTTMAAASVQPDAMSVRTRLWAWLPATDFPQCATMSISKKPGGGSFQSLNVRTAILLLRGVLIPDLRRPCLPASRTGFNSRSIVAALMPSRRPRTSAPNRKCPYRSIASTSVGIACFSRFPQMRSAASQRIVKALRTASS